MFSLFLAAGAAGFLSAGPFGDLIHWAAPKWRQGLAGAAVVVATRPPPCGAGVYAVGAVSDDWPEQRQACIDVLCAYLRMPYEPDRDQPGFREGEREVRISITRVIRDHLRIDAATAWFGHSFDFTGAVFDGGDFSQILVRDLMDFRGAAFTGGVVDFRDATFGGGRVDLRGARFARGTLDLRRAGFRDLSLRDHVVLDLRSARLDGGGVVDLRFASYRGGVVDLRSVQLLGGRLDLRSPHEQTSMIPRLDIGRPGAPPEGLLLSDPSWLEAGRQPLSAGSGSGGRYGKGLS